MKVKKVIELLSKLDPEMDILVAEVPTEYGMGEIESIEVETVTYQGGPDNEPKPKEKCVIIRYE